MIHDGARLHAVERRSSVIDADFELGDADLLFDLEVGKTRNTAELVAQRLGRPPHRVEIIPEYLEGYFGAHSGKHVIEPVRAYIELAERLWHEPNLPPAFNFGPDPHEAADVRTVIELARAAFGRGAVAYADAVSGPHEAGLLALDNSLARRRLAIAPRWPLAEAVARTMHWYREQFAGGDAWQLCMDDLAAYEAAA